MSHLQGLPSHADRVLVVANRTADSDELMAALYERASRGPTRFTLVVPATPHGLAWAADMSAGIPEARAQMAAAEERLRATGLWVDDVRLGSPEPLAAVHDATNFESFSEIIVCTLPSRLSRWLRLCLPDRVQRTTGLPVTHVIAQRGRFARTRRAEELVPAAA
jgi:GABA permease